jgi:hypothetical protein
MSQNPGPSAANIPRLLERLGSGNARKALAASRALSQLAAAGPPDALRLEQCGAVPGLVAAACGPDAAVAAHANAALASMVHTAPGLVADAASSALLAALDGEDSRAAAAAVLVRGLPAARPVAARGAGQAPIGTSRLHVAHLTSQPTNRSSLPLLKSTPRASPPSPARSRRSARLFAQPQPAPLLIARRWPSATAPGAAPPSPAASSTRLARWQGWWPWSPATPRVRPAAL